MNRFHARIRRVTIRLTDAQFNELRQLADDAGLRLATFIHAILTTVAERKEAARRPRTA